MKTTQLGKIENATFGLGGYHGCMLGLHVTISGGGWGTSMSKSAWDAQRIEWSVRCKWSEEDRSKSYDDIMRYISKLLADAKVDSIDKLNGIPVEVTFENNALESWRILTEVL